MTNKIADTPKAPYYAVIFTNLLSDNTAGYGEMAELMVSLAKQQPGYLGIEGARESLGITVSYWRDLQSIKQWKADTDHLAAQRQGREDWYDSYHVRIAKVENDYQFKR